MIQEKYSYTAQIKPVPEKGGAYVEFPHNIKELFGKGRLKVRAYFDGVEYEGSVVNMGMKNPDGSVCYIIGVRKDIQKQIGKQPGDMINVEIEVIRAND